MTSFKEFLYEKEVLKSLGCSEEQLEEGVVDKIKSTIGKVKNAFKKKEEEKNVVRYTNARKDTSKELDDDIKNKVKEKKDKEEKEEKEKKDKEEKEKKDKEEKFRKDVDKKVKSKLLHMLAALYKESSDLKRSCDVVNVVVTKDNYLLVNCKKDPTGYGDWESIALDLTKTMKGLKDVEVQEKEVRKGGFTPFCARLSVTFITNDKSL